MNRIYQGIVTTPVATTSSLVWAFDLGKASLGEAVRNETLFLHAASWLIPAELARRGPASVAGTPASRYRALKTREALSLQRAISVTDFSGGEVETVTDLTSIKVARTARPPCGPTPWRRYKCAG